MSPPIDMGKLRADLASMPQWYRQPRFIAWAAGVLLVLVAWGVFVPSAGVRAFWRSRRALRHATAWRVKGTVGADNLHIETAEEVCPDREHRLNRIILTSNDNVRRESIEESIRIGDTSYNRMYIQTRGKPLTPESSQWHSEAASTDTLPCRRLATGETVDPLPDFTKFMQTAQISKGEIQNVNGAECREWRVHNPAANPADDQWICIGLSDHLPHRVKTSQIEYVFYDWNTPIDIHTPQPEPTSAAAQ